MVNFFTGNELDTSWRAFSTIFTPNDCLSASIGLTKNSDLKKYGCSSYSI